MNLVVTGKVKNNQYIFTATDDISISKLFIANNSAESITLSVFLEKNKITTLISNKNLVIEAEDSFSISRLFLEKNMKILIKVSLDNHLDYTIFGETLNT